MRPAHRRAWLVAAILLLASSAWLALRDDRHAAPPAAPIEFPRGMRAHEWERAEKRRTLVVHPPEAVPAAEPAAQPVVEAATQDPLFRALAPQPGGINVVLEMNALWNSPLGELLLDCLHDGASDLFQEFRDSWQIEPLQDIDRIAISGETLMMTGHFEDASWDDREQKIPARSHGEHGRLYSPEDERIRFATWRGELVAFGRTEQELEAMIDRLEGRASAPPPIDESIGYGELYGILPVERLVRLLGGRQDELLGRVMEVAKEIEFHVDMSHDVALTAEVRGPDAKAMGELARTLGGALALARLQARTEGDEELAALLDFAGIERGHGTSTLELALPLEWIREHLAEACKRSSPQAETEAEVAE